jgi:hypothetical protein
MLFSVQRLKIICLNIENQQEVLIYFNYENVHLVLCLQLLAESGVNGCLPGEIKTSIFWLTLLLHNKTIKFREAFNFRFTLSSSPCFYFLKVKRYIQSMRE